MKHLAIGGLALALALLTSACQPQGGASQEDVQALKDQQTQILAELQALKDGQKKLLERPAAPAAARPQRPAEDYNKVYSFKTDHSPILGNPDAPVTLVEYSDFQCPFCARVKPDLKALLDKYPDKVKVVFKHFPLSFHRQARPAAVASMAAHEQGKFWEYHDVLFKNQRSLADDKWVEYAKEAGLDVDKFKSDLEKNKDKYEKLVAQDFLEGQKNDVRGTPSLYIGGRKVRVRTVEGMGAMIEAAAKASDKS